MRLTDKSSEAPALAAYAMFLRRRSCLERNLTTVDEGRSPDPSDMFAPASSASNASSDTSLLVRIPHRQELANLRRVEVLPVELGSPRQTSHEQVRLHVVTVDSVRHLRRGAQASHGHALPPLSPVSCPLQGFDNAWASRFSRCNQSLRLRRPYQTHSIREDAVYLHSGRC